MSYQVERLRGFRLLNGLEEAELEQVAKIATEETFPAGTRLTEEGTAADRLYLFLDGRAEVRVGLPEGHEGVLDEVRAGEVLGWSAVMAPYRYTASAWAKEEVHAIVLRSEELRRLFDSEHHLGYCVVRNAGEIVARRYGRAIGGWEELRDKDLRALHGAERVIWENGDIQLTTEAILLEVGSGSPEVIPLETVLGVEVDGDCLVLRAVGGDARTGELADAARLAALVSDEVRRLRLPHRRVGE
jgi:CRP-like cAMP-binding protein